MRKVKDNFNIRRARALAIIEDRPMCDIEFIGNHNRLLNGQASELPDTPQEDTNNTMSNLRNEINLDILPKILERKEKRLQTAIADFIDSPTAMQYATLENLMKQYQELYYLDKE